MAATGPVATNSGDHRDRGALAVADLVKICVVVLLALVSGYLLWTHTEWFDDPKLIKAEILRMGVWGPLGFIVLYALGPSLLVPGAIMTLAGGLAFGTLWGSIYAVAGADIGALVAFALGRVLGRQLIERLVGARFRTLRERISRNGFRIILYLRIFPIIPYNALNLIAGASPIRFRDYLWASLIGLIPGTVLFAFLGNELWHPASPGFILALMLIGVCFAAGELYRRHHTVGEI